MTKENLMLLAFKDERTRDILKTGQYVRCPMFREMVKIGDKLYQVIGHTTDLNDSVEITHVCLSECGYKF